MLFYQEILKLQGIMLIQSNRNNDRVKGAP